MNELVVVGNDGAGGGERQAIERAVGRLAGHAPTRLVWTSSPTDIDQVVGALPEGHRVVVAGGDGSVHAMVNALDRTDRFDLTMAVLPFGTGNDLAGGLGVGDEGRAIEAVLGTNTRRIDLLRTDDGVAANVIHLGVGAAVAETATRWKERLGAFAYPAAAALRSATYRGFRASVRVDDGPAESGDHTMIVVANGRRIGGGFPIAPPASVSDGELELVLIGPTSLVDKARLGIAGRTGSHLELPFVRRRVATSVRIETDGVGRNSDGELDTIDVLDVRLDRAAVAVCVPSQ